MSAPRSHERAGPPRSRPLIVAPPPSGPPVAARPPEPWGEEAVDSGARLRQRTWAAFAGFLMGAVLLLLWFIGLVDAGFRGVDPSPAVHLLGVVGLVLLVAGGVMAFVWAEAVLERLRPLASSSDVGGLCARAAALSDELRPGPREEADHDRWLAERRRAIASLIDAAAGDADALRRAARESHDVWADDRVAQLLCEAARVCETS